MTSKPRSDLPVRASRFLAPAALLLLAACAGTPEEIPYVERPVEEIYTEASNAIDRGNHLRAAVLFEEVERQHPYSQWAVRSQLMTAYSLYEAQRYDDAITKLDGFIALHPGNKNVAYAYYLKALSYYEQISDVRRDQSMTQNARAGLEEVVRRFPTTPYARDAQLKLDLVRDHLAGKDMEVGRHYLRIGQYMAALKRFRAVVDNYQDTSHVPEALHRMAEAYLALGIVDEAQATAALLGHNYPGSPWYEDTYALVTNSVPAEERSFVSKAWNWVF
ncbi:outer membrane protein assembly factor BamD [Indioceanicola profundi]|uniref:outer membrane protein assembly factor BamD n=1 Tax=Indioceanicola profundi TaxID=2220096 RepID=UPI000E6ACDAE|nr:outer membrane protein assembly factor BamD [Indioceanicola profundi]